MCNRYSQTKDRIKLATRFAGIIEFELTKRYNIAPTDKADVVLVENEKVVCREMTWGWPVKGAGTVTNAKAETVTQKVWKRAWGNGRCLIPADGFFEWSG